MAQEVYLFPLLHNANMQLVSPYHEGFHLGLRLVRLDKPAAEVINQSLHSIADYAMLFGEREHGENENCGVLTSGIDGLADYGWAVVLPMGERNTQFEEQGISRCSVARIMADGFCAALRVFMCGGVDAPQGFRGELNDDGSLAVRPLRGIGPVIDADDEEKLPEPRPDIDDPEPWVISDDPRLVLGCDPGTTRYTEFALRDENIQSLAGIWRGIACLRGLDNLAQAFSELSFRQMDHGITKGRPEGKELPPEDYAKRFQSAWQERLSKTQNKSRLGRALTLFENAMMMPGWLFWTRPGEDLALFLQSFLVLEALYVCGENDVGRTVALRVSKLIAAKGTDERTTRYDRTRALYQARNRIVHGDTEFDSIDKLVRERAWKLASRSLENILGAPDSEAFKVLSGPEKTDADKKRVQQFWRDLELS